MTEEEAKTKWCPYVRCYNIQFNEENFDHPIPAVNRYDHDSPDGFSSKHKCWGSSCMMWRNLDKTGCTCKVGYCGLAGEP